VRAPGNAVLLTLVIVLGAALAATGFVAQAPNRLVTGAALPLWRAASPALAAAIAALAALLLVAAFVPPTKRMAGAVIVAATALLLLVLDAAGAAAAALAAVSPAASRTSLGPAFWIAGLCAAFAIVDALQRLAAGPAVRLVLVAAIAALVCVLIAAGRLDQVSLFREYAARRGAFAGELARHCVLVLGAVVPALALGAALGFLAARRSAARGPLFAVLNMVQTVPSIALFGLLLAPLAAFGAAAPWLGIRGIGLAPALIALMLYSLLPVARNTLAGLLGVDRAVVEAASGMGMTARQIFWRIELPLGLPVFLTGVRIVLVQAIGLAVVAALVGAGGLGTFVFQGIGQYAIDLVLLGAVPTILLALAADFALAILIEATGRSAR
jgi:osmoprotectant transport system permease protein